MRNLRTLPAVVAAWLLAAPLLAAAPPDGRPRMYRAALDGAPVRVELPAQGRAVSAWTWREAGETDIAVAIRDLDGRWSDPFRFGARDGLDQVEPALVADPQGHVYLAFAVRETGAVALAVLAAGSDAWTPALEVVPAGERASAPALRVVRDRLVIAWRSGAETRIADFPLVGGGNRASGVQDGPDGFDPLGTAPTPTGQPKPDDPGSHPPRR
jgi:hypothetical protein